MIFVKSVVANPNSKTKCLWFKLSAEEVVSKHPKRLANLVAQLKNGVDSASETDIKLDDHIHIETNGFIAWRDSGADINELTIHVTVFSDTKLTLAPGSHVDSW